LRDHRRSLHGASYPDGAGMSAATHFEALCVDCVGCLDDDGYCQACEGQREALTTYQAYKRGLSDALIPAKAVTPCNCIDVVNEKLATRNTCLVQAFRFDGGTPILIETEQVEKGRGKAKAVGMFPTYCPFCGTACKADASLIPAVSA
jgi:hypothetical protein